MYVVFQTETGGYLTFPADSVPTAVSGYADLVSRDRHVYRFDGVIASGTLHIARAGLSSTLMPDQYVVLPQLVDANSQVYFLDTADVQIVEVPSFFEHVVLTPGNSVLVRLNNVESLLSLLLGAGFNPDGTIGIAPSGVAGGDLSGSYPNPAVSYLGGVPVADFRQDAYYCHNQYVASAVWVVEHNLKKHPSVTVHDSAGSLLFGAVRYTTDDLLTITFSAATSGEADCN